MRRRIDSSDFDLGTHAVVCADEVLAQGKSSAEESINRSARRESFTSGNATVRATSDALDAIKAGAADVLKKMATLRLSTSAINDWQRVWSEALDRIYAAMAEFLHERTHEGNASLRDHIAGEVARSRGQAQQDLAVYVSTERARLRDETASVRQEWRRLLAAAVLGWGLGRGFELLVTWLGGRL